MLIDRKIFFDTLRLSLFAKLGFQTSQVDGLNRILDEWDRRAWADDRHLAYMLATVHHETGKAFQPIREGGGEAYLRGKKYYPWVGEGLVQVTWEENARKFGAKKPGDLLTWPIALVALFDGMRDGMFTGKRLTTYFSSTMDDALGARRIINGTDKAALIAGYHATYLDAIRKATVQPTITKKPGAFAWLKSLFGGK